MNHSANDPAEEPAFDPHEPTAQALEHALDVLTAHGEGFLQIEEQGLPIKYVIDPASGKLIASVPVAVLLSSQHLLWVPEESDEALQLLLSAEEIDEAGVTDRWQVYHGTPEHVRWAAFWIDGARHGPWVFDGDACMQPNPLAPSEPALCRLLNADKARLAMVCQRFGGVIVPGPVCVGVDPLGAHVRARFGVVRIRFDARAEEADAARAALEAMLAAV